MRLSSLIIAGWLAGAGVAAAQETEPVPSGIVLDGITTILGDNRVCFKVAFEDGRPEADFMLAEGQARYGIRLLAVDMPSGTVTINEQGKYTRNISICKTPVLSVVPRSAKGISAAAKSGVRDNSGGVGAGMSGGSGAAGTDSFKTNMPSCGTLGGSSTGGSDVASAASTTSTGDSDATSPMDTGDATPDHLYQWWVKEAEKIEQARLETTDRVLAGEWQAYPLTPLTPSGTSAQLIGTNSLFMNHGPGIMISGD